VGHPRLRDDVGDPQAAGIGAPLPLPASGPAVASWSANRLDLFKRGEDNALWHRRFDGFAWSGWVSLGGVLTSAPSAASWAPGHLEVFARGGDNGLWHRQWGVYQGGWQTQGGVLTSAPAAISRGLNRIDLFTRGNDYGLWHKWWDGIWRPWTSLGLMP